MASIRSIRLDETTGAGRLLVACIGIALCIMTFAVLFRVMPLEPFSHDEAVYLAKGRSWLDGSPANEWGVYRPIAMPVFAWVVLHFGDTERVVRTFGAVFGALCTTSVFLLFRRLSNSLVALAVALLVASSSLFLLQAPQFLDDIPSSTLLFSVLWLLFVYYQSAGRSSAVYFIAPLSALAFYLRYGVATTLIIIALTAYLILLPRFLKKEGYDFAKLGKTILAAIGLLVPHFVYSLIATKQFLGVLTLAGTAAGREYLGQGLQQYIALLPGGIGGAPFDVAAIAGSIIFVALLCIGPLRRRYAPLFWISSIGVLNFFLTGLLVHAEPRYVFFSMVLLGGTAVVFVYHATRRFVNIVADGLVLVFIGILLFAGVRQYRDVRAFFAGRESSPVTIAYSHAHEAIERDSGGRDHCSIFLVQFLPRAAWYSKCSVFAISTKAQLQAAMHAQPGDVLYSLVNTSLKDAQITASSSVAYGVSLAEVYRTAVAAPTTLIVYRMTALPSGATASATSTDGL